MYSIGEELVDRKFSLIAWAYVSFTEINSETLHQIIFDNIIPVDFKITAIHRLYYVDNASLSHGIWMMDWFTPYELSEGMTVDGTNTIEAIPFLITQNKALSLLMPNSIDLEIVYWSVSSDVDYMIITSKYETMIVESTQIAQWNIKPDKVSQTLTSGNIGFILILECEVL